MEKHNWVKTVIGGIIFFLISWIATDIMDHQTIFSPHEILSSSEETNTSGDKKTEKSEKKVAEEKAPSAIGYVTVTVKEANIRDGAGKSNAVVTVAKEGETFDLVPEIRDVADISWYEIQLEGDTRGFISAKICEYTPYPEEEVVEEETPSGDILENLGIADTAFDTIYLHAERLHLSSDQLTEEYVESHAEEIIMQGEYHTSYRTIKLMGRKFWHIVCLTLVAMVIGLIFFFSLGSAIGGSKFIGTIVCLLCVAGFIFLLVSGIKDNTEYKYQVEKKYEIHSMDSEDGICTLHYRDADVILDTTIDANKNQVLYLDEPAKISHVYQVEKKPANIWYWLTELSPRERTIYILF